MNYSKFMQKHDYSVRYISIFVFFFQNSGIQPVIQISGPTTLAPGQSAIWTITTVLVDGSSLLSLDIYGTGTYPLDFCSSRFKESGTCILMYNLRSLLLRCWHEHMGIV